MSTYTITISSPESEKDFAAFLRNHADIEATPNEAIQYDPNMYDEHGNFQRISLGEPGLPVSDEYMVWRIKQSLASPSIPWHEAKIQLGKNRKKLKADKSQ